MPTITKDNKIIFDAVDFLAGTNPQYGSSTNGIQKVSNGLASARSFDPYREFGYASPGFNPTDLTNVAAIDSTQLNCVVNGTFGYSIGGTKVHQITLLTNIITNSGGTFPHAVTPGSGVPILEDTVVYKIGAVSYLFYSWYGGTDGDIGRYDFATTFDDDFMSTVPANAASFNKLKPMPLIVGDDDVLYVADGNKVHGFDGQEGANGTLYKDVFKVASEYEITGFARMGDKLAIFATTGSSLFYLGKSICVIWNYLDLDPDEIINLDDNYVSAPFEYYGTIGCFTYGRTIDKTASNKNCKLKIYDGTVFDTKAINIGNSPVVGGVDVTDNIIYWNSDGKIYSFGSPFGYESKLNQIAEGIGTSSGFIKTLTLSSQIASSGTTTSGGMQTLNSNYYFQSSFSTSLAMPSWPAGKRGKIKSIVTNFAKINAAGRTLSLQLKDNEKLLSTFLTNKSAVTADDLITRNEDVHEKFNSLKLVGIWDSGTAATAAPIIDSVEVEFELTNDTND